MGSPAPPPSLSPPAMSASSSTCSSRKSSSCVSRDGQDEEFFSMLESINTFGLDMEQVWNLKKTFGQFERGGAGVVEMRSLATMFRMLNIQASTASLEHAAAHLGLARTADMDFETFVELASKFITEEDEETTKYELKEAFRIYDKHKQGYITIEVLKEILREIDAELTEEELDEIVTEVDEDGSGTVDFQEFMAMMTG